MRNNSPGRSLPRRRIPPVVQHATQSPPAPRYVRKQAVPEVIPPGVGTELKALLSSLGFQSSPTCSCNAMAREMDKLGIDWVKANKDHIIDKLRQEQKKRGWLEKVKAGVLAVKSGLAFLLNPVDPVPGILEEAIRRAEARKG